MAHDVKLGELIDDTQQRDAIHIAIAPVVAADGEKLYPGQDIGFIDQNDTLHVGAGSQEPIGIVDPFLKRPIYQGDRFWMFLYPQTITSLRHDWTHPAFVSRENKKNASEKWLREVAAVRCGLDYHEMIENAKVFLVNGHRWIEQGTEKARDAIYDLGPELFWQHFENATGIHVNDEDKHDVPFCCSC